MAIALDFQNPAAMNGETAAENAIVGVLRYTYNLTAAECADYWSHDVAVAPIFEHLTSDYTGGYTTGLANGQRARRAVQSLGFPASAFIYCAVDTPLRQASQIALAVEYFRGFCDGAGPALPYGSGPFIDACVDAGLAESGWMPETWGPCAHLCLVQLVYADNPYPSTDMNTVVAVEWGGHNPNSKPTPPEDDDMATPLIAAEAKRTLVVRMYQAIANREPHQIDADGFAYWVGRVPDNASEADIAKVEADFRGSVAAKAAGL